MEEMVFLPYITITGYNHLREKKVRFLMIHLHYKMPARLKQIIQMTFDVKKIQVRCS